MKTFHVRLTEAYFNFRENDIWKSSRMKYDATKTFSCFHNMSLKILQPPWSVEHDTIQAVVEILFIMIRLPSFMLFDVWKIH